jgi:NitT/TauT family transport system substrate-binding protein
MVALLLRAIGVVLLATTAAACGPPSSPAAPAQAPVAASTAAPAPVAKDPLRVVYVTRNGAMGPLWTAHDAGIFAKHNIDADMIYISSGTLGMQALLAREVDIGVIGASAAIAANLGGADAIYIGAIQRTFGQWIHALSGITTAADLQGKRVGITRRNSTTEVALSYYLHRNGMTPDQVTVVEVGDQVAMVPAMSTGAVHAAVLAEPYTYAARSEGYPELADLTQLGVEYPQSALTTLRSLATERRDLVERFMRSVYEATHRYKTDRDFALKVLARYFQSEDQELLANVYSTYAVRGLVQNVPRANYEGTRTVLAEIAGTNEQARGANPARFLDLSFVEALDREGLEQKLYGR